jgi:hypothetical protein
MFVSTARGVLVLALAAVGCSTEVTESTDWMLGTFSSRFVGDRPIGLSALGQYHFREDGTLALISITNCGENREEPFQEYKWSRAGNWLVIVDMPEGDIFDEWRVTPGDNCNSVEVDQVQYGAVNGKFTLARGAVCLKELPPCEEGDCATCETAWCDEPPPPCDE